MSSFHATALQAGEMVTTVTVSTPQVVAPAKPGALQLKAARFPGSR